MHIDIIELLRCPRPHEESWLVASFDRMAGRHVTEGRLGCPVCRAEFLIAGGVVRFDRAGSPDSGAPGAEAADAVGDRTRTRPAGKVEVGGPDRAEDDTPLRLAALLDLSSGGGVVVLSGSWGENATKLAGITEDIHLLLHDPETVPEAGDTGTISAIVSPGRLPLAAGAVRGVALGAGGSGSELVSDAVRSLREKGRLIAPAGTALPAGVTELARDERVWVAERRARPQLVSLGRGGPS